MNEYVKLKPLVKTGHIKPTPPDCNLAFGDSKCFKKNHTGKCPTNCIETGLCGGWQPRTGLPEKSRIIKKI